MAFVIVEDGADPSSTEDAVKAACRERLATFKVPDQIRIVAEMPRSTLNKIAKAELRKLVLPAPESAS